MKTISINIWDDYHEDDLVPEGEIQETYMYVEQDCSIDDKKLYLECINQYIQENNLLPESVILNLKYYDSKKAFPMLVGKLPDSMFYIRWELWLANLTHSMRESLVEKLNGLTINNVKFCVYSES